MHRPAILTLSPWKDCRRPEKPLKPWATVCVYLPVSLFSGNEGGGDGAGVFAWFKNMVLKLSESYLLKIVVSFPTNFDVAVGRESRNVHFISI